jgi:hypothetical protein
MNATSSLRMQIEKWFGSVSRQALRITRISPSSGGRGRCVIVEAIRPNDPQTILFFRHGDGSWCVYPPRAPHLSSRTYLCAA